MRFVFTPPADHAAGLLTLPWSEPLAEWQDERLVEIRQRGISRHVVRFVYDDGELYALKELNERLARRECRLLRLLAELNVPAVEVVGVAVDRDGAGPRSEELDAVLVTKFLSYATTYQAVFSHPRGIQPTHGLLDALVELLVRLHLSGFFWGDCSLSNTLFRHDAGTLEAYLVDAETSEQYPALTSGQRTYDVELPPAEVFSEVLEHHWYMSEAAGRDVGTTAATKDYIENVLPAVPDPLDAGEATGPMEYIDPLGIGEPPGGSVPA
jgi:hypothetical protein